ncbi:MAG: hypothetical protein ACRDNS_07035 [Trebonia sp.]
MREVDKKRAMYQGLVERVLNGEGRSGRDQRARAFSNGGLPPPLDVLVDKVTTTPNRVTAADFATAKAAGYDEDQLFELVICAAVGQSGRLYDAGLSALAEATAGADDAS